MSERRNLLQESLAAIERLQARLDAHERAEHEPIAIVGAGCRYPGGIQTPEDLWRIVRDGIDAVDEVPADRWKVDAYWDADPKAPGKMITRRGGFLGPVGGFDAQFFGISPREASTMDPQQRLLLETAAEAIESAGLAADRLTGSATGVFVGITTSDYGQLMRLGGPEHSDVYSATGSALNAAAGRLSFAFGFQGPCVAIDTACSSSLVAVHLACRSLRDRESDLALAGGVNVILSPDAMILFSKWGMMAPDGKCKTFDAAADGFVRAEGCAMIALKRLSDAQAAGDPILAVIRGSAVNSDGRSSGLTVPNGPAQQAVLRKALADATLEPADIDYVEAHGTGTPLGDPIEIEALGTVMRTGRRADAPLLIGSIKTNVGHTEAASGLAGLLKVVMSLQNEAIPPHLHFTTPNPGIAWSDLPLRVPTTLTPWLRGTRARRAGVSSFGFSGTNAHVVLEEAPLASTVAVHDNDPRLIVVSARADVAVRAAAARQADYLAARPHVSLASVAATLAAGRTHHETRVAFVADSTADAEAGLRSVAQGGMPAGAAAATVRLGERPRIAFLFTGQGSQYPGMGRRLYDSEPVFRESLDRCASILEGRLRLPLLDVLFSPAGTDSPISQTAYTQPALFALEYSLAELWRSWGVIPSIVAGHSVGEYVAACVADVFSLEDGLALIAARGALMQALPAGGAMAAVFADERRVDAYLETLTGSLAIAAVNGPEETVISGDADALARVLVRCTADGIGTRALTVSHAFHSPLLDPMLDEFERRAAGAACAAPRIPLVSNLTGAVFAPGDCPDSRYWRRHARESVRFAACIDTLGASGASVLLEVGPHPTLLALAARAVPGAKWGTAASLRQGRDDRREMQTSLGICYVRGVAVKWESVMAGAGQRIALPTYPFQRERHWVANGGTPPVRVAGEHPLLGERQISPQPGAQFLSAVRADRPAFLAEHIVFDHVLMPGTAYVEMALAAARAIGGDGPVALRNFVIESPLRVEQEAKTLVHVDVGPAVDGGSSFIVRSAPEEATPDAQWRVHARGVVHRAMTPDAAERHAMSSVETVRDRCGTPTDVNDYYALLERMGLRYGPLFRAVRSLHLGSDEAVGLLEVSGSGEGAPWTLHPALLDAAFHVLGGVLLRETQSGMAPERIYVPVGIDEVHVFERAPSRVWAAARIRASAAEPSVRVADLRLEDESGHLVASITGLQLRAVTPESIGRSLSAQGTATHSLIVEWRPARTPALVSSRKTEHYVLIADARGFATRLSQALRDQGALCTLISAADPVEIHASLLACLRREAGSPVAWIIDCAALDADPPSDPWRSIPETYRHLLAVAQALEIAGSRTGLCVITRGAQAIAPGDEVNLTQASLLGLARSIAAERSQTPMARLDLDPAATPDEAIVLQALGAAAAGEPELGVRNGEMLAPRLRESSAPAVSDDGMRAVLRIRQRGSFEALEILHEARRVPGPGEVEIAVHAAGLNFRDVLNTLGMYPGDAGPLGSECSGVVVAAGDGVTHLRAGDEVVAFAIDSMASHVTTSAAMAVRKPESLGFAAAVTVPNAYLTAAYSLHVAAGIRAGQRVLIHAAAGGVGLAALRLARRAGADVIATAGSEEKRAVALAEGASHAFDSRSPSFADDVLRVTDGAGVDIVLNSLAGDLIAAGMRCLPGGGYFVEIGKGGIWSAEEAALRAPGVRYVIVDLGRAIQDDAPAVRGRLEHIFEEIELGWLEPLPVRAFPLSAAVDAFGHMAAARHVGKIVLVPERPRTSAPPVLASGTYLVTGGLGGLGLATANWLSSRGAGEIVLVGRRPPVPADEPQLERMRAAGTRVTVVSCDIGDPESVRALWRDVLGARPPLRGIVHAAGVNADAPLHQQDAVRFDEVARAKIPGAWHLHEYSAKSPLDFFVLYSSASALFGSAGQANYAAANSFLDGLAAYRQAHGLCATSVGWGAWDKVGMAARTSEATRAHWARLGIGLLSPEEAFPALERALEAAVSHVAILAIDPHRAAAQATPGVRALLGLQESAPSTTSDSTRGVAGDRAEIRVNLSVAELRAAPATARPGMVETYLRAEAARVLGLRAERLDTTLPLASFGFDSLMAVQLKNRIEIDLRAVLPMTDFLQGSSVEQLAVALQQMVDSSASEPDAAVVGADAWEEGSL